MVILSSRRSFADVLPRMRIAQEEIFGPVVSVLRFATLEEAIAIVNDVPFGLSSAIYTRDVNNSARAERDLQTGLVYINASTIGAEIHLPFRWLETFRLRASGGWWEGWCARFLQ